MNKNTRLIYILSTRDPSPNETYKKTKSKRVEKDISYK